MLDVTFKLFLQGGDRRPEEDGSNKSNLSLDKDDGT